MRTFVQRRNTYKTHPRSEARRRSAAALIKVLLQDIPDVLTEHRRELLGICLWKITEADGKRNTPYWSKAALSGGKLEHEHVFQRKQMIDFLLEANQDSIDSILDRAVGCIVTTQEHMLLERFNHLYGWERYKAAGIAVVDMRTGEPFVLP